MQKKKIKNLVHKYIFIINEKKKKKNIFFCIV
jgi:hypothetical protein